MINIQTTGNIWNGKTGMINVLDMTGKVVASESNVVFSNDGFYQIPLKSATGIYIVELRSGVMRYVGKVVIR
jgi:hypothetical protein